jgi:sarcosine oxidase
MASPLDAIVVGLGAMGSASLYHLARSGAKVLGIDRFAPPHALGSSHGSTRITRLAIGEGTHYSPLALRSHTLWREIEAQTGRSLLVTTGGLILSGPQTRAVSHVPGFFANTVAAARAHGVRHELLDARQLRARFPQFHVTDDEAGYFEPDAGFLRPEECVAAQLELARMHGAAIRTDERVTGLVEQHGVVRVATERGDLTARQVVLTAGPWLPPLLPPAWARLFTVRRQVQFWFATKADIGRFAPGRFPVFIWEPPATAQPIYGFPAVDGTDGGVKIATEQTVTATTPETVARTASADETREMFEAHVAPRFPDLDRRCVKAIVCLYTMTPDSHFIIDRHPELPSVLLASPCSGHGFKHSAALGEALAQLVLDGRSTISLLEFAFRRFLCP